MSGLTIFGIVLIVFGLIGGKGFFKINSKLDDIMFYSFLFWVIVYANLLGSYIFDSIRELL